MAQVTARLDPRGPLVLDLRELGRRAGSMQTVTRTVPAPVDLGTAVIGAPQGSDVDLDLRLESLDDGVLVSGTARVRLVGECVRCLDRLERERQVRIQELFVHGDRKTSAADEGDTEFEALPTIEGDLLDLEPTLRDAVVLDLPLSPVCRDDCPGLCVECGARLADDPDHGHDAVDARWAALAALAQAPEHDADARDSDQHDSSN